MLSVMNLIRLGVGILIAKSKIDSWWLRYRAMFSRDLFLKER